jgi:hypothetical protein
MTRTFSILLFVLLNVACGTRRPLVSEIDSDSRFRGRSTLVPLAPAPVFAGIVEALQKEGFAVTVTNVSAPFDISNPGFESDHVVAHFAKSTMTGSVEHYRDIRMDHFKVKVQAADETDTERFSYYRFSDSFHALLDKAYGR